MLSGTPVLVIGAAAMRDSIVRVLPRADVRWCENPLQAVWMFGESPCNTVIISLDMGAVIPRVIEALRHLAPEARIILYGRPHQEPIARHLLHRGATDYLLEPIARDDLVSLFDSDGGESALDGGAAVPRVPSYNLGERNFRLPGEIIQSLGDGPVPTLERMGNWVRHALEADFLAIEIHELKFRCGEDRGDLETAQIPIGSDDRPVGYALLKFAPGRLTPSFATHIAELIGLVEACVAQARELERLRDLAWTDHLTGLRNRRFFEESLARLVEQATADRSRITLLLFDIDDFKTYNDRWGYETGDALLREVGALLTRACRSQDIISRFGGDEFVVVFWDAEAPRLPGSAHPTDPTVLADRFQKLFREHRFQCLGPHAPATATISGGLASFPWDGRTAGELTRTAENALRAAKQSGKNRIQIAAGNSDDAV